MIRFCGAAAVLSCYSENLQCWLQGLLYLTKLLICTENNLALPGGGVYAFNLFTSKLKYFLNTVLIFSQPP